MPASSLDTTLSAVKKLIPQSVFSFFQPAYHTILAYAGAAWYGFPSRSLTVIGITGTKGKSTVAYLATQLFKGAGKKVAMIGSLGYVIGDTEWPNTLKMTMPGRFRLQKFLRDARRAGCEFVVMEVTSEGIAQKRHCGVAFDAAVFTNLHPEHIESHGSFEAYRAAKQELFRITKHVHVINADDPSFEGFSQFPSSRTIFFGIDHEADMRASDLNLGAEHTEFSVYGTQFSTHLTGRFNVSNCLAVLAIGAMYGIDLETARPILAGIQRVPGRMEFVHHQPAVIVDYAHTPDSLAAVYHELQSLARKQNGKLIVVLGAAGGGRDTWKRPAFGTIAQTYADHIFLTDEDPYEENPEHIIDAIRAGINPTHDAKVTRILDRRQAIESALAMAGVSDVVVMTGKGSEVTMAIAGGKKIPWSDADIVRSFFSRQR